jgi:3-oxoacyl-[acyl-carrier protein] reductase
MDRLGGPDPDKTITTYIPLQRMGEKDDIAAAQLFLLSPAASYITGQTLVVDGGQVLAMPNFLIQNESFFKSGTWSL